MPASISSRSLSMLSLAGPMVVPLEGSVGRHGGDFICPYPPGSPLVVPGEVITEEMCRLVRKFIED